MLEKMQQNELQLRSKIDGFILLVTFILANLRATVFIYLYPDTSIWLGPAWIEIALWLLVVAAMAYQLKRRNEIAYYFSMWRRNWPLIAFVLLALISIFWSVDVVVTLFRVLELLLVTLIAVYIGTFYRPEQIMAFLFLFGAILLILSVAMVFGAPKTGTMYWKPFYGAWRGIYWHRNHLASITVLFNAIFLCRMFIAFKDRNSRGFLDGIFYIVSLLVMFFAKSATGYILFIVSHFAVFCFWLWLHFFERLQRKHYYILFGISVLAAALIFSNLDIVFGLFNRSSSLTGRAGLWDYLLKSMVSQRPWLGYGFGAFWTLDALRENVRQHIGWVSQPLIGDNGFLDILLHVGAIGLLLFLMIFIIASVRSFRYAISHRTLVSFFPFLVMVYALFANISFSLFAETEVFVWFLIVVILFTTMHSSVDEASC